MSKITIIDYGIGNLFSVARAVEAAGGEAELCDQASQIAKADRVILPGVGAFGPCMSTLRSCGMADAVREFARSERPFLGICVGMQLLFDYSLEFGRHEGLGLIAGHVGPILEKDNNGSRKVPHVGWNAVTTPPFGDSWEGTVLADAVDGRTSFYFVHSFNCQPSEPRHLLARADYEGFEICAAVRKDNITAFQCHPEKSGAAGLRIFTQFLNQ